MTTTTTKPRVRRSGKRLAVDITAFLVLFAAYVAVRHYFETAALFVSAICVGLVLGRVSSKFATWATGEPR